MLEYTTPTESNTEPFQSKLKAGVRRKRMYRYTAHTGTAQILQTLKSQNQLVLEGSGSGFQEDTSRSILEEDNFIPEPH